MPTLLEMSETEIRGPRATRFSFCLRHFPLDWLLDSTFQSDVRGRASLAGAGNVDHHYEFLFIHSDAIDVAAVVADGGPDLAIDHIDDLRVQPFHDARTL